MNAKPKRLAVTLTITVIFLSFTLVNMKTVSSSDTSRKIDIFTQKVPFSGMGVNQSSDAFQPQELVIIYALVTYNEGPTANNLVAFQVGNPANAFQNITAVGISSTNESGIAWFSFRIPWPYDNAEQIIFGRWFAIATAEIAGQVVVDTVTFQVGWIIETTSITTLNEKFEPQTKYQREETIVFDLTIENIALIPKSATIIIDAQDEANYPVTNLELDNIIFQPGENHVRASSQIPTTAAIGEATVSAAAFTASSEIGGVPYSPAALSAFEIILPPSRRYYLTVRTDPSGVVPISGEGWYNESTNISLTASIYVSMLPGIRYRFSYWDVDGAPSSGNPIIVAMNANCTAIAHYVLQYYLTVISLYGTPSGESWYDSDTTTYAALIDGIVDHGNGTRRVFINWSCDASGTNSTQSSPILMDRPKTAVANWQTQYQLTVNSDPLGIITILGEGWYNEGDRIGLTALPVEGYDFAYWDVDGVSQEIGVNITTVHMNSPHIATAHYRSRVWLWFYLFLLLVGLMTVLLIAWLYRRRRKKKAEEAFYKGWTAWYYSYDLRGKVRRI